MAQDQDTDLSYEDLVNRVAELMAEEVGRHGMRMAPGFDMVLTDGMLGLAPRGLDPWVVDHGLDAIAPSTDPLAFLAWFRDRADAALAAAKAAGARDVRVGWDADPGAITIEPRDA